MSINYGSLTTQGIINNLTLTNNGIATFNSNIFCNGNLYFGAVDSNTDILYFARSNLTGFDVTEMIAYIGDNGITGTSIPTFPPEGSAIDYFTIRTVNMTNPQFAFASNGNFHCGKNINCNGKLILLEPNGDQIQITSNNNNWLFKS